MDQLPPPGPGVLSERRAGRRLELAVREVMMEHFVRVAMIWIILFLTLGIASLVCFVIVLVQFANAPWDQVRQCDSGSLFLYVWLNIANLVYQHTLHYLIVRYLGYNPLEHDLEDPIPIAVARWGVFTQSITFLICIFGVMSVSEANQCPDTAPKFFDAVSLFVWVSLGYSIICLVNNVSTAAFVFLIRNGHLSTKDAAPQVIELCTLVKAGDEVLKVEDGEEAATCPICMEELDDSKEIRLTPCKHAFHASCLQGWLNVSRCCPMCRHPFLGSGGGGGDGSQQEQGAGGGMGVNDGSGGVGLGAGAPALSSALGTTF